MEGILFCEDRLLNGMVFHFGMIGCLMEGILFWEGRYLILAA